ncbi:MAG: hypothetical protein IJ159_01560 [Prevotella sp.]|nr:hypothetical protein [Prevotella sp.]
MNFNYPNKNGSTIGIRLMCAIVFLLFSVCWLYYFQAEVLGIVQHELSGGVTKYHPYIGTLIITGCLFLLHILIYFISRLNGRTHALTYLPSMLILALMTDVCLQISKNHIFSISWWLLVLVLVIWLFAVFVARAYQITEKDDSFHFLSRPMWINLLIMALMILGVSFVSNTNAVFHYKVMAESKLMKGDYNGALLIGKKSQESDASLTMIRMYALAKKNRLGDELFRFPVTCKSNQILPTDSLSQLMILPADSIYYFLGARPARKIVPKHYLEILLRKYPKSNKNVIDYLLCCYLIERDLDNFADKVSKYYTINDNLPKHYREALILYTHMRSHPVVVYHEPVMEEDYSNLQELEKQYPDFMERKGKVEDIYRETYWYYFTYEN